MLKGILRRLEALYERYYPYVLGDLVVGFFESRIKRSTQLEHVDATLEGFSNFNHLVGMKGQGIVWLHGDQTKRIYHANEVYGITYDVDGKRWYAYEKQRLHGRIISFVLGSSGVEDVQVHLYGLSKGVHQILINSGILYVCDTYNNAILMYSREIYQGRCRFWRAGAKRFFPGGRLKAGRRSENYHHFNSICLRENKVLVFAHNETYKTGKHSQVFTIDVDTWQIEASEILDASNGHNIGYWNGTRTYCDSLGFVVCVGEQRISLPGFTRGLSADNESLLCGYSPFQIDRARRGQGVGGIVKISKKLEIEAMWSMENVQVLEVRQVDVGNDQFHNAL